VLARTKHWVFTSCRLLFSRGKANDRPALLGRNPCSALFSEFLRHVKLDHSCHRRYHSQPHSQRMRSHSLALRSTRLHAAQHRIHIATSYIASRNASGRDPSSPPALRHFRKKQVVRHSYRYENKGRTTAPVPRQPEKCGESGNSCESGDFDGLLAELESAFVDS
jgi:hypothetical protein